MNSEEKEQDQDQHNMTRRQAVKALAGAAAVVAAIPAIGSIAVASSASQGEEQDSSSSEAFSATGEPLVVLVGKGELRGFVGEREYTIKDSGLTRRILGAFSDARTD
jgi:hypothetical protein